MLRQLAQIVGRHPTALELHGGRQLVKDFQSIRPIALALIDPHEVIECRIPVLPGRRKLLEQPLSTVHEAGAQVIQSKGERCFIAQSGASVLLQARMDGDRAVDLAPAPEQTPQRELDFGSVAIRFGHPRENLRGVVEPVIDKVIEADVVVAWQAHCPRGNVAAAEKPRRCTDDYERQCQ